MNLFNLAWVFTLLALLAVGGGTAVLPEMQELAVNHFHWVTDAQFREIYGLGQVAPGPNMTMVLLIGYRVAGVVGAIVVGLAFFLPDCILTLAVNRLSKRFKGSPWHDTVRHGMAPVAIGLMASGTYTIAHLSILNGTGLLITLVVMGLLLWRRINPAFMVIMGGMAYLILPHVISFY